MLSEDRTDPENPEGTGSENGDNCGQEGMSGTTQSACGDLIQIADRLKKQNTHDTDTGILNNSLFRGE